MHDHRLVLKSNDHTNQLQNVKFKINSHMLNFVSKFKPELTCHDIVLLTDQWINPEDSLHISVTKKWSSNQDCPKTISHNVWA